MRNFIVLFAVIMLTAGCAQHILEPAEVFVTQDRVEIKIRRSKDLDAYNAEWEARKICMKHMYEKPRSPEMILLRERGWQSEGFFSDNYIHEYVCNRHNKRVTL